MKFKSKEKELDNSIIINNFLSFVKFFNYK